MRLVVLIEAPGHVCYRYRIQPFEDALADAGITVQTEPIRRGVWRRWCQLRRVASADGVLIQRKLLSPWEILWLRRHAQALIYDVDDAVFQRDSFQGKKPASRYRRWRFYLTVQAADLVIAGNDFLASHVRRAQRRPAFPLQHLSTDFGHGFHPRCLIVPTCVDTSKYPLARHSENLGCLRLVWIGSSSTLPSLERASTHLRAIADRVPQATLRVVCDRLPCVNGITLELWPWSQESEALALATADIGIAWMPPDSWSRGKCGLKVLQYMAAGLPVVANPVGVHNQLVVPNKTGYLADQPAEWAEAVFRLASAPHLRRKLGREGRQLVDERYHPQRWAEVVCRAIAQVLSQSRGAQAKQILRQAV